MTPIIQEKRLARYVEEYKDANIEHINRLKNEKPSVFSLIEKACEVTGAEIDKVFLPTKISKYVLTRQIVTHIMVQCDYYNLFEAGSLVSVKKQHHTTARNSRIAIDNYIDTNAPEAQLYLTVKQWYEETYRKKRMSTQTRLDKCLKALSEYDRLTGQRCRIEFFSDESGCVYNAENNLLIEFTDSAELLTELYQLLNDLK